ncbi:hypothetical protein SADUNF_Sadunf12G0079400 [Salix dunnii]|uniref:HVA22-like protein n=1 Tax=Salix dunnii TaxID=1413687 RepID=A0A835MM75_9ROSI|nr:hypothetical protein SADUNF_Sadunf12G0079400 [Salix dunnii]
MLLYPLYASVIAIESPNREDDKQWLAYWILYSFLTLAEMLLQPLLEIRIWCSLKLLLAAWLVLPQFKGAAFIYERFVREHIRKFTGMKDYHPSHPESPSGSGSGGKGRKNSDLQAFSRFLWSFLSLRKPTGRARSANMGRLLSFLTQVHTISGIPIWYSLKLVLAAWLVLPQFKGAAFIYERYVREHIRKFTGMKDYHLSQPESPCGSVRGGKDKKKKNMSLAEEGRNIN